MIKTLRNLKLFKLIPLTLATISYANYANAQQSSPHIKPFTATYTIIHKSDPVGTGVRQLKYLADNQAEYSYHSDIKWLIFSDQRQETSRVNLVNSSVTPVEYKYAREGTGRDKHYHWTFDVANNSAEDLGRNKKRDIEFPSDIQDKLSYHLQHRLSLIATPTQKTFTYPVISTSGKIKDYTYQYDGEEELMLPYGLVKTIRFKREVTEKKRITYAWFAPELNYLLVKLYQMKSGVEQLEAQLAKLEEN
ncbi:DUF3108 domain-containing protein [Thalassotalea sp. PLHSN55]|uniref:DUF3108 domain-containing protein n=1 Tax=Thalassotalea sp. PLHSN55 TaxID=3435888 RepID=UPI003F82FF2D